MGSLCGNNILCSSDRAIDHIHCHTMGYHLESLEPWIESSTYSGYKKRHTLKYEVAVTEETGTPVHVKGPYPGPTADVTIFQESLKVKMQLLNLPPGLADGTYLVEGVVTPSCFQRGS